MEHQDWTTVVLKRRNPKDSKPAVDSEKIRLAKLEQTDDYAPPKKRVSGESIQALIRKRKPIRNAPFPKIPSKTSNRINHFRIRHNNPLFNDTLEFN
jgi:hypothetical protein